MTTSMQRYWVAGADGQTYGPVDMAQLQQWVQQGTVTATTTVCFENDPNQQWFYANQLPQLGLVAQAATYAHMEPTAKQIYGGLPHSVPFSLAEAGHRAQNTLSTFNPWLIVLLHFVTCGLFTTIWFGIQHGNLPKIAQDDPGAGKAIGFLFIPIYGIYWLFIFWLRLCDRINLQLALRGLEPKAPRGLVLAYCIIMLIPYIGFLGFMILGPIVGAKLQIALNQIADKR